MANPTAIMILIGDELLSGRTQDKNLAFLAGRLSELGIALVEARFIPDKHDVIVNTVNELRSKATYIFTTGGIGPTHDDITTQCIADAFGVQVIRDALAEKMLRDYYAGRPDVELNAARLKMADVPEGAKLIKNIVSGAAGFIIGNVHVMAGVPRIFQAMLDEIIPTLQGGEKYISITIITSAPEGDIANIMGDLQKHYSEISIGSYPQMSNGKVWTNVVLRGINLEQINVCKEQLCHLLENNQIHFELASGF